MHTELDVAQAWLLKFECTALQMRMPDGFDEWDDYLDARDRAPFQGHWMQAHGKLTQRLRELSTDQLMPVDALQTLVRERFFKKAIQLTGSSDLAAYASDDAGLIIGALAMKLDAPFVDELRSAYEQGSLPVPWLSG